MKRVVIALLVFVHVFGIIGCGKDKDGNENKNVPRTGKLMEVELFSVSNA